MQLVNCLINGPADYAASHHLSNLSTIGTIFLGIGIEAGLAGLLLLALVIILRLTRAILAHKLQAQRTNNPANNPTFLELTFPADTTKSAFATKQLHILLIGRNNRQRFASLLAGEKKRYALELVATKEGGIRYVMMVTASEVDTISRSLVSFMPGLKITEIPDHLPELSPNCTAITELKLTSHFALPLQSHEALAEHDPIAHIAGQMTKLAKNELIALQIVASPVTRSTHISVAWSTSRLRQHIAQGHNLMPRLAYWQKSELERALRPIWYIPLWLFVHLLKLLVAIPMLFMDDGHQDMQPIQATLHPKRDIIDPYEGELASTIKAKLDQHLFEVTIRILTYVPDQNQIAERSDALVGTFTTFASPYQSIITRKRSMLTKDRTRDLADFKQRLHSTHILSQPVILSSSELSDLYHFPNTDVTKTENLITSLSRTLPAPVSLKNDTDFDLILGRNHHHGSITDIGLTQSERERHIFITGGTGNGKTTMMLGAMIQDVQNGKGFAFIDPHGDASIEVISHVPKERIKDVIYFNPDDLARPIGLNLLELPDGLTGDDLLREKDRITESTISVFRKIFSDTDDGGHRIEYVLRNSIQTALTQENATLFTVFNLLNDPAYRKKVISSLTDPDLKNFWKNELGKAGDFQRVKMAAGITAKIGRFLFSASAKRILEQPKSSIDFGDILNSGKILVCNFSKGLLGEDTSELFGITVLAKLQMAALRRARMPEIKRRPFYLYVDEFQNFATTSFVQMLSEARKYKLFMTLAEQSTAQQTDLRMTNVILANVGTVVCFRSASPADEQILLPLFRPYIGEGELASLPSFNFYMRLSAIKPQEPLSGETIQITSRGSTDSFDQVVASSRSAFGKQPDRTQIKTTAPQTAATVTRQRKSDRPTVTSGAPVKSA